MTEQKGKVTKAERDEMMQEYELYSKEVSNLKNKARRIGYKPVAPKLPKRDQRPELLRSTMRGFVKRFGNWKFNFIKFEDYNEQQERD